MFDYTKSVKQKLIMKRDVFRVLTNDPRMTAWGWAVVDANDAVLESGCIKTEKQSKVRRIRKGDDDMRRVSEINQILISVIEHWHVNYLLAELPHGSQSASAAMAMGRVGAILQTLSDALKIPIEWYSEADAKKAVLGKRSSTKQEMVDTIKELYLVGWTYKKYKDEAVADALAIHHVAKQQSSVIQYFI